MEHFGGHYATQEELERCLKEIDESTAIVSAHNKRQIDFICSCCDDCCAMADLEHHGLPIRIPSRFRPSVVTCPAGALRMQVVHDVDWIPDYWADDNNWNIPGENTADYIEKLRAGQD